MKRVLVIGSPGAGKSHFSTELSKICSLPLYHLDMIWHKADRTNVTREEFDRALAEIMSGDGWIIDGNYKRTLPRRLECCDTVFLFDLPMQVCLDGARGRVGKKRPDLPFVEGVFDPEFEEYIKKFPDEQLPIIYSALNQYRGRRRIVIFKSREAADAYLERELREKRFKK